MSADQTTITRTPRRWSWWLLPLLLATFAAYVIGRHLFVPVNAWYQAASDNLGPEPVAAIFIGQSWTGAAIDAASARQIISQAWGGPRQVLNLGQGGSSLPGHYLGLRHLARRHPNLMKGCTVFVEAPCGLPSGVSWQEPWMAHNLWLLASLLEPDDLPRLWASQTRFGDKLALAAQCWAPGLAGLLNRPGMRDLIFTRGRQLASQLTARLIPATPGPATPAVPTDLAQAAGIRTDNAWVARVRQLVQQSGPQAVVRDMPQGDWWEISVLRDLADLVANWGGRVVVFTMPMSPLCDFTCQEASVVRERARLRELAPRVGLEVLEADFSTTPDDFPDLWHLRHSRAPDFTRRLLAAWLASHPRPPAD